MDQLILIANLKETIEALQSDLEDKDIELEECYKIIQGGPYD